jgi:hypothetical protein
MSSTGYAYYRRILLSVRGKAARSLPIGALFRLCVTTEPRTKVSGLTGSHAAAPVSAIQAKDGNSWGLPNTAFRSTELAC